MSVLCRFLCIFHVIWLITTVVIASDTEKDHAFDTVVKKALIATARSCMDQINATEADLEYLRNDPPYPQKAACIIKCLLETVGVVKNNKYSKNGFMTVVTPLVFRNKKKLIHMNKVSEDCDKESDTLGRVVVIMGRSLRMAAPVIFLHLVLLEALWEHSDMEDFINHHALQTPCDLGNEIITCIFKYAPELHFKA